VFFPLQTYRSIVLGASRDSAKKAYLYAFMQLCRLPFKRMFIVILNYVII
jgi:hypothetical protein